MGRGLLHLSSEHLIRTLVWRTVSLEEIAWVRRRKREGVVGVPGVRDL